MTDRPQPSDTLTEVALTLTALPGGGLRWSHIGPTPTGEKTSDYAALRVVEYLRERRLDWSQPVAAGQPEQGIDFVSTGSLGEMRIQTTRVPSEPEHYRELSRAGYVERDTDFQSAARDLVAAIRHKARNSRATANADITLVLDAQYSLAHGFSQMLEVFNAEHSSEAMGYGFREIWLVTTLFTRRLTPAAWPSSAEHDVQHNY